MFCLALQVILNQPPRVMPTGLRNTMAYLPNPGNYRIIFYGWLSLLVFPKG